MKSWADHCSSDEESDGNRPKKAHPKKDNHSDNPSPARQEETLKDEIPPPLPLDDFSFNHEGFHQVLLDMQGPPFSAHIKNLSFHIHSAEALSHMIEGLVDFRYRGEKQVSVSSARIGTDRETGQRKGYAIIGFDTVEELKILLNLNDGHSFIEGRQLRMDVATSHMKHAPKKYGDIDGSQFRGGKFLRNETAAPHSSSMTSVHPATSESGPVMSRKKSSASDNNLDRKSSASAGAVSSTPPVEKQRPTLKLIPRSKQADGAEENRDVSSGIFGGARPRDEVAWTSSKAAHPSDFDKGKSQQQDHVVGAPKHESVHDNGTLTEEVELKTESNAPDMTKREKKFNRGPRNDDRPGSSNRPSHYRDDRSKREHLPTFKDVKTDKHGSKTKDASVRAVKDKSYVDGWEDAPLAQREKRVINPVVSPIVQEPAKPVPVKKLTNAFELLNYDDSDSD